MRSATDALSFKLRDAASTMSAPTTSLPTGARTLIADAYDGLAGLSEGDAAKRLIARGRIRPQRPSRSYTSIVRANVLTVFNAILAGFGALTLAFGDWRDALFLGVIVANSGIGITQEVRAKRALDRLSLLVAPHATVKRGGAVRPVGVEEVVVGDVALLTPGDQVTADGRLLAAVDLRLDEAILTGESEPAHRLVGEEVRSGAFVVEGSGAYEVSAVGGDSFAARVTGEARSFRHPRSPLERAVNRLLYVLVALVLGLGALLAFSLYHRHVHLRTAVATSTAGVVSMIPEGLMVLVSLTYAAGALRMSRRGVLAQQLNAIESLASVDTICIDKTGTLTDASLRVVEVLPARGTAEDQMRVALGELAASASARNATLQAIADACPGVPRPVRGEVAFSSRRRWSAVSFAERHALPGRSRHAAARRTRGHNRRAPAPGPAGAGARPWRGSATAVARRAATGGSRAAGRGRPRRGAAPERSETRSRSSNARGSRSRCSRATRRRRSRRSRETSGSRWAA